MSAARRTNSREIVKCRHQSIQRPGSKLKRDNHAESNHLTQEFEPWPIYAVLICRRHTTLTSVTAPDILLICQPKDNGPLRAPRMNYGKRFRPRCRLSIDL